MSDYSEFWRFILMVESVVLDVGLHKLLDQVGENAFGMREGGVKKNKQTLRFLT